MNNLTVLKIGVLTMVREETDPMAVVQSPTNIRHPAARIGHISRRSTQEPGKKPLKADYQPPH